MPTLYGDHSNSVAGRITRASFINSFRCQQNVLELTIYGQIEGNGYVELAALLSHYASKITSLRLNSIPSDESLTILSIKKFEFFSNRLDNITATGWRAFSAVLSDKTCALETLSLECTKMDYESATFLGDSLAANTTVKYLSLQGSRYITPGGWDGFACCLRSPHSALEELDISMCNSANDDESDVEDDSDENDTPLNDYGAIAIAESLAMNSSLKKLNLSWNWITPEGWIEFFDVLLHSECSLEELDLSHNDIDDEGVDALVDLLASMRNFHTLSLHPNSFSMTGLRALTRLLQPSYNVESIIIGRTEELFLQSERDRFNDEVAIEFADVLANNTSLNTLSFGGREVTGRGWTAFFHALCDKSSIDSTFSSNHSLHDIEAINGLREDIPDDLSSLLNMNRNQDKAAVARQKVLEQHFSSSSATIEVFVGMSASALPRAIEWIGRDNLGSSLMHHVAREIPLLFKSKDIVRKKRKHFSSDELSL